MNTFKTPVIIAASLGMFIVVGTMINSSQAVAQNPHPGTAPVNIVSPLPLPVTGSTSVSGTVSVQNVDEPGRSPYQEAVQTPISFSNCNQPQNLCHQSYEFSAVPAGKRLVILGISAVLAGVNSRMTLRSSANLDSLTSPAIYVPLTPDSVFRWVANAETHFYVDQQDKPVVTLSQSLDAFGKIGTVTLTGYYVSLP